GRVGPGRPGLGREGPVSGSPLRFRKGHSPPAGLCPYLYDYALTLNNANQVDRAHESAEAAAQADPNLSDPHALLGRLFASQRQLPAAAKEYHEALRLRPDFGRIRLDLASVLVAQGDMRQAVQQLREAVKSGDPEIARLAAEALQRLGER